MTLDSDLAAVRAVARQLRTTTRPLEPRRLSALASSLDHSVRGLGRGVDFLRAEADGKRPPAVELGDPEPYRGLDLHGAARALVDRMLAQLLVTWDEDTDERVQRMILAEVDAFTTALSAPGSAGTGRGVSPGGRASRGPSSARSAGSRRRRAAEPRPGTNRRAVLDAVAAVARDPRTTGLTDVEIQRATGLNPNSARPRRVELVNGGWLADSGVTREHYGREHAVWVLTDKAARLAVGVPVGAGSPGAGG